MYLSHLHVDSFKLLREFELDFTRDGKPRMWTVLVGRNGLCKTSILRAIALAASGRDLANELSGSLRSSFWDLRDPHDGLEIVAKFQFGEVGAQRGREFPEWAGSRPPRELVSRLELGAGRRAFSSVSYFPEAAGNESDRYPLEEARQNSLPHWFVAAYGVNRSLPSAATTDSPEDFVRVRLETLFGSGQLISTDFADHLAKRFGAAQANVFADLLHRALLTHARLLPQLSGFELRGRGGVSSADRLVNSHRFDMQLGAQPPLRLPATWLSHGYQATLAWLADLVGHVLWEARSSELEGSIVPEDIEGLVLVDELDLHLHPTWQVGLITALKQTFPRVQFIVTTHSPMLLSGLESDEIVVLDQDRVTGDVIARREPGSPKLQTSGELLERYFDLDELDPTGLTHKLHRYGFLANNPYRSEAEDEEMSGLRHELDAAGVSLDWGPVARVAEGAS